VWFLPVSVVVFTTIVAIPLSRYMAWIMDGKYRPPSWLRRFEERIGATARASPCVPDSAAASAAGEQGCGCRRKEWRGVAPRSALDISPARNGMADHVGASPSRDPRSLRRSTRSPARGASQPGLGRRVARPDDDPAPTLGVHRGAAPRSDCSRALAPSSPARPERPRNRRAAWTSGRAAATSAGPRPSASPAGVDLLPERIEVGVRGPVSSACVLRAAGPGRSSRAPRVRVIDPPTRASVDSTSRQRPRPIGLLTPGSHPSILAGGGSTAMNQPPPPGGYGPPPVYPPLLTA
jgi:hypothetical protein